MAPATAATSPSPLLPPVQTTTSGGSFDAGGGCSLTLAPTRAYGGEPVTVTWRFPKMVLPRHAWIGIFADEGDMNAETALARYEGLAVRKLRGSIDVLLPPTIGDYRVAYFTTAGLRGGPHEGMVAGVYLQAPRDTSGPIASPQRVNYLGAGRTRGGDTTPPPEPKDAVVVRPSWVPFDTKRAKDGRVSGAILRREAQRSSVPRPQSLSPTPGSERRGQQLPPMSTPPPRGGRTEYVCVDDYADEQHSKAEYSKHVLTLVRKQQKVVGRANVTYIGSGGGSKKDTVFGLF